MVALCVILLLSTYICSLSSAQNQSSSSPVLLPPIQQTSGDGNICTIDSTVNIQMRESIARGIEIFERPCSCGSSRWTRVAYLNMSEASTTCPSSLSLHSIQFVAVEGGLVLECVTLSSIQSSMLTLECVEE